MAIPACRHCGAVNIEISKTCEFCGKKRRRGAVGGWVVAIGIFVAVNLGVVYIGAERRAIDSPISATVTSDRETTVRSNFSAWDGSHPLLEAYIKDRMNDPSSYEHIETRFRDDGDTILLMSRIRERNEFGTVVLRGIKARADEKTGEITGFSKVDLEI